MSSVTLMRDIKVAYPQTDAFSVVILREQEVLQCIGLAICVCHHGINNGHANQTIAESPGTTTLAAWASEIPAMHPTRPYTLGLKSVVMVTCASC